MGPIQRAVAVWRARSSLRPVLHRASPSFSQYGEDLIFDRLLSPGIGGVYVDVGANEPIDGSNTFRMYLRGWSGLAIDPNPRFAADFRRHRPRDKHLVAGVSRRSESLTYHEFDQHVFNTLDPDRAAQLVREGRHLIKETSIQCRPLSQIVDQYLPDRHIDLLNVDCEGLDLQVLESLDLTRRRPTTMIVEDYRLFKTFQTDDERGPMGVFLRDHGYRSIAQTAWSGIYVAEDCATSSGAARHSTRSGCRTAICRDNDPRPRRAGWRARPGALARLRSRAHIAAMPSPQPSPQIVRVIDLETTGNAPPAHAVLEIGWQDVALGADGRWELEGEGGAILVNPGRSIPPVTQAVHHILDEQVADAPWWHDVARRVLDPYPRRLALAAHRASFEEQFCTSNLTHGADWICTWKCALRLWPDSPAFSNQVLRYWRKPHGIVHERGLPSHRAFPDAYVTAYHLRDQLNEASAAQLIEWSKAPGLLPRVRFGTDRGKEWREIEEEVLIGFLGDRDPDVRFTAETEMARRRGGGHVGRMTAQELLL